MIWNRHLEDGTLKIPTCDNKAYTDPMQTTTCTT
jgi:hypothetical protein